VQLPVTQSQRPPLSEKRKKQSRIVGIAILLMFIPSIFIYLGFLEYLNYILKIPCISYRCFWPLAVSLYPRIRIAISACRVGDS
jgi:hypothetical protein